MATVTLPEAIEIEDYQCDARVPVPTPDEIQERAASIRNNWSERERRKRQLMANTVEVLFVTLQNPRRGFWMD